MSPGIAVAVREDGTSAQGRNVVVADDKQAKLLKA